MRCNHLAEPRDQPGAMRPSVTMVMGVVVSVAWSRMRVIVSSPWIVLIVGAVIMRAAVSVFRMIVGRRVWRPVVMRFVA